MGNIGRHDEHLPGGDILRLAADGDFRLAVKNIDHRVKGSGVLTQSLARIEREERDISDIFFDQCFADYGTVSVVNGFLDLER